MKKKVLEHAGKIVLGAGTIIALAFLAFFFSPLSRLSPLFTNDQTYMTDFQVAAPIAVPPKFIVTHVKTPETVKAIYMTSWVAGSEKLRSNLLKIVDETEINSVVIDIKDYTGRIAFEVDDPKLKEYGSVERRITDIKEFIGQLHDRGVYVIGRISCFQDSYLVKKFPEYAVKDKSGAIWGDRKNVHWLDAGARPVWDYLVRIGNEAYAVGFDELNFDYIRFPSDGNMENIAFPFSQGKKKSDVLKEFYAFLEKEFRPRGITISADLFGMTTTNSDDLGIGQILGDALVHFDYVAPMVYPSHYPANFNGWKNPATVPYELIKYVMEEGIEKARAASTTPAKLRPWLQDFGLDGVPYNAKMIREQIQATYDVGLNSWMMWNASNRYTDGAYKPEISS